ncbi:HPF/RaiA family ribosome-associated protein [Mesobaculum littorinae]|nr:HPF/RaiA family ribosome-associated protein [Mesobaculum littorinae]
MDTPLELAFHNMDASPTVERRVRERARKMERYFKHITSAHVVVELDHKSGGAAKAYHVRIEARVPGKELVVSHDPGKADRYDVLQTVNAAFDAMDRQLEQFSQTVRGDVKTLDAAPTGRVRRLFGDYGFIETAEGEDIWFHRASVSGDAFDQLSEGDPVALSISREGNNGMGPQAASVRPASQMAASNMA